MTAPLVTVIIATYNYSVVLRCAIESVLRQTFTDYEIIVVGDGCTDDSETVVAAFNEPRLHWHNLPENHGNQAFPNNKGIELARGQYIAYLGHDDLWHPTHLEKLVAAAQANDAEFVNSLCVMIAPEGSRVRSLTGLKMGEGTRSVLAHMIPGTALHTRALVERIGGWGDYRTLDTPPQVDFFNRALAATAPVIVYELTVFKFPAAWQRGVYLSRPSHQQETYLRRMATEPDFMERELLAALLAEVRGETWIGGLMPPKPVAAPPGWRVEQYRRLRGLEARPLPPPPPKAYVRAALVSVYRRLPEGLKVLWRRLRGRMAKSPYPHPQK